MAGVKSGAATVEVPIEVLNQLIEAQETLDDWILTNDKHFIKKMKKSRKEDLEGKTISWQEAKKKLAVK